MWASVLYAECTLVASLQGCRVTYCRRIIYNHHCYSSTDCHVLLWMGVSITNVKVAKKWLKKIQVNVNLFEILLNSMWHHRRLPSSLSGIILFLIITEKIEIVLYHHHVIIVIIIFLNLPGYLTFIHLYAYMLLYSIKQDAMAICLNSNPVWDYMYFLCVQYLVWRQR